MSYTVTPASAGSITLNESDTVRSVLQNIKVILATKQLTVPLYREFGLEMRFVDKPLPVAKALMIAEIKEALARWEPRAELVSVDFQIDADVQGRLIPFVEVEIVDEQ